jgi:hypothetical protein
MSEGISFEKMTELGTDLGRRLGEGASSELLTGWASGDGERIMYLVGTVFGTIRWGKLHGRPKDLPLASGFSFQHQACWFSTVGLPRKQWQPIDDIGAYDVADKGDDYYRVGFGCVAVPQALKHGFTGKNRVIVSANTGLEWVSIAGPASAGVTGEYMVAFNNNTNFKLHLHQYRRRTRPPADRARRAAQLRPAGGRWRHSACSARAARVRAAHPAGSIAPAAAMTRPAVASKASSDAPYTRR